MNTQKLSSIVSDRRVILTAVSAVSLAAGFASGYKLAQSRLEAQYSTRAEQEIAEAKAYYSEARVVQEPKPSLEEVLKRSEPVDETVIELFDSSEPVDETVTELLQTYGGEKVSEPEIVEAEDGTLMTTEVQHQNIFEGKEPVEEGDDEWSYEFEMRMRDENPDKPFIIHHDEFFENEREYEQGQLTYYRGDDTLVDDQDVPVPDTDATVGDDALVSFGHGSKDKNTVYVRNERLEMDFEIVQHEGKFSVHVLGFDDEDSLQHSYSRSPRKFRESDD